MFIVDYMRWSWKIYKRHLVSCQTNKWKSYADANVCTQIMNSYFLWCVKMIQSVLVSKNGLNVICLGSVKVIMNVVTAVLLMESWLLHVFCTTPYPQKACVCARVPVQAVSPLYNIKRSKPSGLQTTDENSPFHMDFDIDFFCFIFDTIVLSHTLAVTGEKCVHFCFNIFCLLFGFLIY